MYLLLLLLCLNIGLTLASKQGDFGILKACTNNNTLRLECFYTNCTGSPPYYCQFKNSTGAQLISTEMCKLTLRNHAKKYRNETTSYNCTLNRNGRLEEKQITINYNIKKGKGRIKPCRGSAGLIQHPVLALWPLMIQMWTVLVTEN